MPTTRLLTALLILVVALAVAACGDDGEGDDASPTNGGTATASATPDDNGETPSNGNGSDNGNGGSEETPAPDKETPIGGNGGDGNVDGNDGSGGDGPTPAPTTDATPAPEGRPAVQVDFPTWKAENYPNVDFDLNECVFNPATLLATCGEHGAFAPNPPLTGEDVSCVLSTVDGEPVHLRCSSQNPLTTNHYEVVG